MKETESSGSFYGELKEGDEVQLLIDKRTDLGYNVLINNKFEGLLYGNEVFERIQPGDVKKGYIKLIREDGKIDVSLQKQGYAHVKDTRQALLHALRTNGGLLKLGDKSSPEEIYDRLKMSKKAFKRACGALYKDRLIFISDDEITLIDQVGE